MQRWISHTTAPMGVIFLLVLITIYFAADFISKKILQTMNLILIFIMLLYAIFGIYAIVLATQQSPQSIFIKSAWTYLSAFSKIYYYNNDINVLYNTYFLHMILTGSIYLFIFVFGFFLIIFNYIYTEKIDIIWRPPLRSKLRDERAERYINHYARYNKEYKMLLELQEQKDFNNNKNLKTYSEENNINNNMEKVALKYENYGNNFNSNYNYNNLAGNFQNDANAKNYYNNNKIDSHENLKRDISENDKISNNALDKNNKSDSKKHLLTNENKNINSNKVSRSGDKNNIRNSNENSIANNINNVDEKSNILENNNQQDENAKKNVVPPTRKLIKRSKK